MIEQVVESIYSKIISKIPDSEFIIVNDRSTDNTSDILKRLSNKYKKIKLLNNRKNMGYSKTIRRGYLKASKDWIFDMGSDNEHDTAEYWKLDRLKSKYDIILGYRKHRKDPLHRLVTTRLARLVNFILFGSLIKDSNSGFRLTNRKVLHHIISVLPNEAFAYDILVTIMGKNLGYRIIEIPVTHFGRQTGKCHYPGWKLAKGVIRGGLDMLSLRIKAWSIPESEYKKAQEIRSSI